MESGVDFKKYKYYYNGWLARKDRVTNKTELFYKGKWTPWVFSRDLDLMAHFGDEDVSELSDKDEGLLLAQIKQKIDQQKTI